MVVGKTTSDYLQAGIEQYLRRLKHYVQFEIKTLQDIKPAKNIDQERQKQLEGEGFLKEITPADTVILLDERGKQYTSREFSKLIENAGIRSVSRLVFVVGGPYGFSEAVYSRANSLMSLSKMTFSHEMIRLFFVEQVYRAMTILRGEPYHHD